MSEDSEWEHIDDKYSTENFGKKIEDLSKTIEVAWVTNPQSARSGFYFLMDNVTKLISGYLHAPAGTYDWLDDFKYSDGALLTAEEKEAIKKAIESNKELLESMRNTPATQSGGDSDPGFKVTGSSILQTPKLPFDISLDRGFEKVNKYFNDVDKQVQEITSQIGPTAFISKLVADPRIPLPFPPGILQVPKYSILPIISVMLETMRTMLILSPIDFTISRKLLSITQAIYEFSIGNWRQAILTFMSFFGQSIGLMTTIGKFALNAWLFVEPSLRSKIGLMMFRGTKSMIVSFMIWLFHVFAPDMFWIPISQFIATLDDQLKATEGQVASLEQQLTSYLQGIGYSEVQVKLPTIEEIIAGSKGGSFRLSYDDLQNVQRLLAMPEIYCSKEGQAALAPLMDTPLRIILELMNIPTTTDTITGECKVPSLDKLPSMSEVIAKTITEKTEIVSASAPLVSASPDQ
jgi:hypothetical protein